MGKKENLCMDQAERIINFYQYLGKYNKKAVESFSAKLLGQFIRDIKRCYAKFEEESLPIYNDETLVKKITQAIEYT